MGVCAGIGRFIDKRVCKSGTRIGVRGSIQLFGRCAPIPYIGLFLGIDRKSVEQYSDLGCLLFVLSHQ